MVVQHKDVTVWRLLPLRGVLYKSSHVSQVSNIKTSVDCLEMLGDDVFIQTVASTV